MVFLQRIQAFAKLGEKLQELLTQPTNEFLQILQKAESQNPWFTQENSKKMLANIAQMLNADNLQQWIESYNLPEKPAKTIAVIMAGNIPMVGFHDALCVLVSGNALVAKLSSKDAVLLPFVFDLLVEIEPEFADFIHIEHGLLKNFDAIIATGSNNSARHFEYYFGKYPHIIRKNRNSVAVLNGNETVEELQALGNDIFDYFGLGCRSVAKLYVPRNYDFTKLFDTWDGFWNLTQHNKYMNNYEYNKSILLVSGTPHFDTGYALFTENSDYNSAIAVNHFEQYENAEQLAQKLQHDSELLQCVVSSFDIDGVPIVRLGAAQENKLSDYADGVDVVRFLTTE
ncbi:MAG: acyl-CoA reductase [Bacteroidetes bacterium]|nr:acyl-CoA reductase [Bacteroidota bacterium]